MLSVRDKEVVKTHGVLGRNSLLFRFPDCEVLSFRVSRSYAKKFSVLENHPQKTENLRSLFFVTTVEWFQKTAFEKGLCKWCPYKPNWKRRSYAHNSLSFNGFFMLYDCRDGWSESKTATGIRPSTGIGRGFEKNKCPFPGRFP